MQKRTHTAGGKNPATSRILGPDGVLLRSHAEFWSRQTVCKVLWTTVSPDCDTCLQTDPWHFLDDLWWTVVGVHTLYQFTTKVTYSFFLHSVTVPGILRIDSLTFQTSVFILHLPEKQLCGSSPIHFFFFFLHNLHRLVVSLWKTVQFCRFSLSELAGEVFLGLCVWTSHSLPRHACFLFCVILILSHRQTNCRFGWLHLLNCSRVCMCPCEEGWAVQGVFLIGHCLE